MSEAARKSYFFVPPGGQNAWRDEPPSRAGHYWVRAKGGGEPQVVWFDPADGCARPAGWRLADSEEDVPAIAPEAIASWWPAAIVPPGGGLPGA